MTDVIGLLLSDVVYELMDENDRVCGRGLTVSESVELFPGTVELIEVQRWYLEPGYQPPPKSSKRIRQVPEGDSEGWYPNKTGKMFAEHAEQKFMDGATYVKANCKSFKSLKEVQVPSPPPVPEEAGTHASILQGDVGTFQVREILQDNGAGRVCGYVWVANNEFVRTEYWALRGDYVPPQASALRGVDVMYWWQDLRDKNEFRDLVLGGWREDAAVVCYVASCRYYARVPREDLELPR